VYFVHRSAYDGLLSKRVIRLPDLTVLAWFQRVWNRPAPREWIPAELGRVYGFATIFEAVHEHDLPRPRTIDELRALLHEHLYVEGQAADCIRLDEHSLRVRTDDDEVDVAYYFLDEEIVATAPDRLAYLVHEAWPLPDDVDEAARPDPIHTYAIFISAFDRDSFDGAKPVVLGHVGLPRLAGHLRSLDPRRHPDWPDELLVLRALVAPDDVAIDPAMQRCIRWPEFRLDATPWPDLPTEHDTAHTAAMPMLVRRGPATSSLRISDHLAQLALHYDETYGYQQWFLFDSVWAVSHPDLARSLRHYVAHWDPLAGQ
jgi:hypothetical protein